MRLKDKVALVTGAGQGIGRGIAERFAQEGAKLVINDINNATLQKAEAEIKSAGHNVLAVQADVSQPDQVARMFGTILHHFGTIDVLVNNAAWAIPTAHFLDMTEDFWDTVIRINLKSVFLCSHHAVRIMADQKKPGTVVHISSFGALRAHREMVAYDAAKGAIEASTRAMAVDLAPWGIRVNAVGPGLTATPAVTDYLPTREQQKRLLDTVPLERLGQPSDIAAAVLFLASDEASYITGQILYVDGGVVAQLRPAIMERHHKRPSES
ncbi:MAG: 3-oxoacyl-ACP reductase FabG [Chloroflexi bacterium]|nr:3-oxoacyl-ACP reductase FabG [Chloroflexota bacterium]